MYSFKRNLKIGFSLSLLLLIASSMASYRSVNGMIDTMEWVDHTNTVSIELNQVLSALKDSETGMRGYLLTGDRVFLEPYNNAYRTVSTQINHVGFLTRDNMLQRRNIRQLRETADLELTIMKQLIERHAKGIIPNIDSLSLGKFHMDKIRKRVDVMNGIEQRLLVQRSLGVSELTTFALVFIALASLLSIVITIFYYFRINGNIKDNEQLRVKLEEKSADIERQIGIIKTFSEKVAGGDYSSRISKEDLEKKSPNTEHPNAPK